MKGKINKCGYLEIIRHNKLKKCFCPFNFSIDMPIELPKECGDWCSLFGEPRFYSNKAGASIIICENRLIDFNEFTDEREVL